MPSILFDSENLVETAENKDLRINKSEGFISSEFQYGFRNDVFVESMYLIRTFF